MGQVGLLLGMNLFRRIFFELFYLRKPPWDTGIVPPEVQAFVISHPAGRALDLGCGTGTSSIFLAQHAWQVTAIDYIGRAIQTARHKAQQAGVQVDFRQGDVTQLAGVSPPFDLVLDIGCFHSLAASQQTSYLRWLEQLLKPSGTYLLYTHLKEAAGEGPGLTPHDLERLQVHLKLVERQQGSDRGRPAAWFEFER
jgi:SAM-dependent methyltransferase